MLFYPTFHPLLFIDLSLIGGRGVLAQLLELPSHFCKCILLSICRLSQNKKFLDSYLIKIRSISSKFIYKKDCEICITSTVLPSATCQNSCLLTYLSSNYKAQRQSTYRHIGCTTSTFSFCFRVNQPTTDSKITKFHISFFVKKDVRRFNI